MNRSLIVYDLETKRTFAEVRTSPDKYRALEVSFLGLYSYTQDKFFSFFEDDLSKLEQILIVERPTIIGFNSLHFDNQVVQPYFKTLQISSLPQVDILDDIYRTLGFRMKLESVAQATVGEGKSGSGLDAIRYFREGNLEALAKYCLDDVRITRDIYDYGCRHGYILFTSGGESHRMNVQWSTEPTLSQSLQKAWQQHQRVHLEYVYINENQRKHFFTEADILDYNDIAITVYGYQTNEKMTILIDRILNINILEEKSAYQSTLF